MTNFSNKIYKMSLPGKLIALYQHLQKFLVSIDNRSENCVICIKICLDFVRDFFLLNFVRSYIGRSLMTFSCTEKNFLIKSAHNVRKVF